MARILDHTSRSAIEQILTSSYAYSPEGLVDEIDSLFADTSATPFDEPIFIQVRDSIWLTFPSKRTATDAAIQIFQALSRSEEIIHG